MRSLGDEDRGLEGREDAAVDRAGERCTFGAILCAPTGFGALVTFSPSSVRWRVLRSLCCPSIGALGRIGIGAASFSTLGGANPGGGRTPGTLVTPEILLFLPVVFCSFPFPLSSRCCGGAPYGRIHGGLPAGCLGVLALAVVVGLDDDLSSFSCCRISEVKGSPW